MLGRRVLEALLKRGSGVLNPAMIHRRGAPRNAFCTIAISFLHDGTPAWNARAGMEIREYSRYDTDTDREWPLLLGGIWHFLGGFWYADPTRVGAPWNNALLGLVVAVIAGLRLLWPARMTRPSRVNVVLGLWLAISGFVPAIRRSKCSPGEI